MRIYKGDVGYELTVQSFLDLLEEDALDELIDSVLELDAHASLKGDFDGDMIHVVQVDLDEFDGDLSNLFDHITDNIEHYEVISQDDFDEVFGHQFLTEEDIMDNLLFSNEDLRLKRIVERFRHIG
jgi:hypothetical protein